MQNVFLIVHNQESYEKHPDLIGFYVKTDLDGKPIRDEKNEFIPEHSMVKEIKPGYQIVYYTRGDHLIRGIFEVGEKLKEGDDRRAEDWTRSLTQFTIKPILIPKTDVDFLIFIRRNKHVLKVNVNDIMI